MKLRTFIAILAVMVISIGVLAVGYISTNSARVTYSYALEDYYQRTFYELLDNVNDIELNLSKAIVATSKENQLETFEKIYQDSATALCNLSRLPIDNEAIYETTRLMNQLGGFTYSLIQKLKNQQTITQEDFAQLETLYDYTKNIQVALNEFQQSINYDFSFVVNSLKDYKVSRISTTFNQLQSSETGVEYPTLIYDGPFSESVMNKKVKGLNDTIITKEEGEKKIFDDLGAIYTIEKVEYSSFTQGKFATLDYKVSRKDLPDLYVQISQQGGMFLTISAAGINGGENKDLDECKKIAQDFIDKLGFEDMQTIWGTIINNTAYINLTTVKNDVIVYPEMIKIKVNTTNGDVIGMEATNYAYNKQTRTNTKPTITLANATKAVDKRLTIHNSELAIIPKEYGEDVLCYEFVCTLNNYTYYVYINATTGIEENILRIVQTDNGELIS